MIQNCSTSFLPSLLRQLKENDQIESFLEIFFTPKEREMLQERLLIFSALSRGATQREVAGTLGCSVVTVTRGAKAFREHEAQIRAWLGQIEPTHPISPVQY